MKIGTILLTNQKGQIVIPQKIRKSLGITPQTPLQISQIGNAVVLNPIVAVVTKSEDQASYLDILKKTAGSWINDDWQETEKKRRRIELEASKKRKKAW